MPTPLICPTCGAPELTSSGLLFLRGFKVHTNGSWWHQCLRCAGLYLPGTETYVEPTTDAWREQAWFRAE